jgi:hypothetical protein
MPTASSVHEEAGRSFLRVGEQTVEVQSLYHLVENDGRYMSQANIRTVINTCALRLQGSTIFLGTKRIPFSELDQGTPAVNSILDIMVKRPT